ncbi:MAG: hypothetical protein AAGF11_54270 [Myxococcota bacterium]
MRRSMLVTAMGVLLAACPQESTPSSGESGAELFDPTADTATDGPSATDPTVDPIDTTTPVDPWFEVGWGVSEFNAFEGILPIVIGPQGLAMFSMPLRGAGFYNPPDPSFDNPDMPMLQAWVDVPGYELTGSGHFNEVLDYPALFYPSLDSPGVLEGPAVWLVLPDEVEDPAVLTGLPASLHAQMVDANGVILTEEHDLVIGEAPEPPPGP